MGLSAVSLYLILALATGISAYYELFGPALKELKLTEPENVMIQSPILTFVVLTGLATIFAPLVLPIVLIPSWSESAKAALITSFQD